MSIVTVTILKYPRGGRYRAFANVGRWLMSPFKADGLQFQKLLGSGQNFGLIPDLSTYVFLGVWNTEIKARHFFDTPDWQFFLEKTDAVSTLWLQPYKSQGHWDGLNPFATETDELPVTTSAKMPVAVLTRATIRTRSLLDFWRHVPQARQRLQEHRADLLFSIGVGEKPIMQQATISVWRSADAVEQFAYRQSGHREIVRLTRQRKWYSEELFARFSVLAMEGDLFKGLCLTNTDPFVA